MKGSKSGSSKQRKAYTAPDSAASISTLKAVYGLAEGEIAGLENGLASVFLDGTPIENSSGQKNLEGIEVEFRKGTNDQEPLLGFPNLTSQIDYNNIEITDTKSFIHRIDDTQFTSAYVRLEFGALYRTNTDNADTYGNTIEYAIDIQVDGLGFNEYQRYKISDKTSANHERGHEITLPEAESSWDIRVRRLTRNENSQYVGDKMYIASVAEIVNARFNYPNTAVIGISYDASRFSSVAKLAVRLKGKLIRIPANLNPETGAYATTGEGTTNGTWNGQFKWAYSNNPAWVYYDLCLNKRYGLGNRLSADMMDKWSLYVIGKYCDELVPDGKGGLEKRFTVNVYINTYYKAYDLLLNLTGIFRGIVYWTGTAISLEIDRPRDPVYTYNRSNVIGGTFTYTGTKYTDRYSAVTVEYDDPDLNFKTTQVTVFNKTAIQELGVKTLKIQAFGVTSRGQAQRAGYWALYKNLYETRSVSFSVGMDGYIAPVGKIIEIGDEKLAGRAIGGRVAAVSEDGAIITLDRIAGKAMDRLVINGSDGILESRTIMSVNGKEVYVSPPFMNAEPDNAFGIDSEDLKQMKFTVVSCSQDSSNKSAFTISAVQHEPAIFDASDYDVFIEPQPISVINPDIQDPVSNIQLTTQSQINQGISVTNLQASWNQPNGAVVYRVEWQKDDGQWIQGGLIYSNSFVVEDIYTGVYKLRVTAINASGIESRTVTSNPFSLVAKYGTPPALAKFEAKGVLFGMELTFAYAEGSENGDYVEIKAATFSDFSDAAFLTKVPYPQTTYSYSGLRGSALFFYQARLVDKNGFAGPWTEWISGKVDDDPEKLLDILSGHIGIGAIDAELAKEIDDAGKLADTANKAAQEAQNTANTARNEIQNAVNDLTTKINTDVANANQSIVNLNNYIAGQIQTINSDLNNEINLRNQQAANFADGITNVNTKADGITAELNNYKTTTNQNIANIQNSVSTLTSATSSNSTAISQLDGRVQANTLNTATALQKAETALSETSSLAQQTTALRANIGAAVLSAIPQAEQPNKFTAMIVPRGDVGAQQIPSYEHLANTTPVVYSYLTQDLIHGSSALENTIGFFRAIVVVSEARTIVLNDFVGDDAHAIYVDGKLYYSNPYHNGANPSTISINLSAGSHILDFAFNNGGGGWGIKFSNSLAGQLNEMYAATIDYIDKANSSYVNNVKATADNANSNASTALTQIQSLTSKVDQNSTSINNFNQTKADKTEVVSIAKLGLQSEWRNDADEAVNNLDIGGRNLFPVTLASNGYFSGTTGNIITANLSHKAYNVKIPVGKSKNIVYQVWNPDLIVNSGYTNRVVFFDANNTLVKYYDVPKLNGTPYQILFMEVPANAASFSLGAVMGVESATDISPNIKVKFEFGNKGTDWTPAPEDVTSNATAAAASAVASLQIGGRNLAKGTASAITSSNTTGTNKLTVLYYLVYSWLALYNKGYTKLCVSFDWKYVGSNPSGTFRIQQNASPYASLSSTITVSSSNTSGRVSGSLMTPVSNWSDVTSLSIRRDNMDGAIEISNFKIEIGTKATDWTPAPEDIVADLATYKATADQTYQTKTDANQANATFTQLLGTKAEAADLLATKADIQNNYATKSSVNESVATASQSLTSSFQAADQNVLTTASEDASSKAEAAKLAAAQDASTKANAATQTAAEDATNKANNAIQVAANDATQKANNATSQANSYTQNYSFSKTETNNAIAGSIQTYDSTVTIGGNNLYRGSKDWSNSWNNIGSYEKVNEKYKELSVLRSYSNWSGIQQEQYFDLGVSYTLSAWIRKSASNVPIHFWGDNLASDAGSGTQKPMEPNVWTRVTHTFKGNGQVGNGRFERVDNGAGGYYDICGLKLERGSKATDWSPNPNDIVDGLVLGGRNLFNRNVVYQELAGARVATKVADGFDVWGVGENNAVLRLYNIHIPVGECVISFDHFIGTAPFTLGINADDGPVTLFTAKGGWNHYEIVVKNTVERTDGWLDINGLTGQQHQFRNFMVEKGNKASAYRPAPEDTDYAIQQVQANITSFQQAQANVDQAQTQRLNEAFSQIGNNSSRITNVEQTKADTSQVSSIARNDLSSEWNNAANNAANNAVNSLQIGGTNLLPNTEKLKGWGFSGGASVTNDLIFGDFTITKSISPFHYSFLDMALIEGQTYTLSGWIRSTQTIFVGFFGYSSGGQGHQTTVPNQWKRWTHTFVAPNSNVIRVRLESGESTQDAPLYTCGLKLETGNKATDWSPAPSDVTTLINWQTINEAVDLNNMTTTGKYLLKNISANSPVDAWAYLTVDAAQPDRIIQTIWKDSNVALKLERNKFDSTWSTWLQRATQDDINNYKSEAAQTFQTKASANETTAVLTQSINSKATPADVNALLSAKVDAKDITYRVNLNDMRTVGTYLLRGGWDNGAYPPEGAAWHWLEVKGGIVEGRVQQTMWPDNSTGTVTNRAFNGSWSDWNTVANTQQVNGLRSEVQNTYSTKADTANAISEGINAYKSSLGSVLSYKLSSVGNGNSGYAGIRNTKDEAMYNTPRSYAFAIFNNGNLVYWNGYDVYANAGGADQLAAAINNMASNEYGVVITSDEPRDGRSENLKNALVSIGGTRAAFDALQYRGAYILVGRKGLQEGGGLELLSNGTQIEFMLQFINGVPVGVGGNSATAQQTAANANVITETQTKVTNLQNDVSTLSQQTTTITGSINKLGASSTNLLKNSDFNSGLDYWGYWSNIGGGTNIRNPPDDWAVVADESRTAEVHVGGSSDRGGYASISQTVPVVGGKWYQFSGFTGIHRASYHKYIIYWNNLAGQRIGSQQINATMWAGGKKLSDYFNAYFNAQAPGDAVSATCEIGCGGGDDIYMFMTRFNFCQVSSGDSALVPWSPSSFGLASQLKTQAATIQQQASVVDGINAKWTVKIDNNGYASGFGLISTPTNGGVLSAFMVNADAFVIGKAGTNIKPFVAVTSGQVVDGVMYPESGVFINSAWISKATIKLAMIDTATITSLRALTATFGLFVSGTNGGARVEQDDNGTRCYDSNGTLRTILGKLD